MYHWSKHLILSAKATTIPPCKILILAIKADVEGGTALAEALAKHPLYFDDLFCNLVRAGEAAGVLENLLDKIATYKEKTESIKGKIKKALFYPAAVIIVAILVTVLIMIFVIPQFESLFSSFGGDLPAFTKMVVAMSKWMTSYWWLLLFGTFAAVYFFGITVTSAPGKCGNNLIRPCYNFQFSAQ